MTIRLDDRPSELTKIIIGAAFEVSNTLGHGFLEAVYQRALVHELSDRKLRVEKEVPFKVEYKGVSVGSYYADILVERLVVVELKTVTQLNNAHVARLANYLKVGNLPVGLLFNFSRPRLEYKRMLNT